MCSPEIENETEELSDGLDKNPDPVCHGMAVGGTGCRSSSMRLLEPLMRPMSPT